MTGVATTPTAALAEVSKLKLVTHGPIEMESVWPMLAHFHLGQLVYSKALLITPQTLSLMAAEESIVSDAAC